MASGPVPAISTGSININSTNPKGVGDVSEQASVMSPAEHSRRTHQ